MPLPSSGSISIAQVAAEMGVSLPLDITSTAVRNFVGKPTGNVILPNDFWGKSSRTVSVNGFMSPQSGGGSNQRDRGTFTVGTSPAATITAWAWDFYDPGYGLSSSSPTASSFTLTGPYYDPNNFPAYWDVTIWCTVTIGGQQFRSSDLVQTYGMTAF